MIDEHTAEQIKDTHDRMRRVETRITKLMQHMGVDAGGMRPIWRDGTVIIPNPQTGFQDILSAVPPHWPREDEVFVQYKGRTIGSVLLPLETD